MIIERIKEARAAEIVVIEAKQVIQNIAGYRRRVQLIPNMKRGGYGDPVVDAVQLREYLSVNLEHQEKHAAECHLRMNEELNKIPCEVTRKIFLYRYYDSCKWGDISHRLGIGVQAAKMRHQRYLEKEGIKYAV